MSKPTTTLENLLHNSLLHLETLIVGVVLIAAGFALNPTATLKYASINDFISSGNWMVALVSGALLAFGFILAYSQQYFAFSLISAIREYSTIALAAILSMIGQLLIGLGNSISTTQPLYGYIIVIAGYTLYVVALILSGNTGAIISKLQPTTIPSKG